MGHIHGITDSGLRFIIDARGRQITAQDDKLLLIQGDHNSERLTFEVPRFVEGHDMSECSKIEVHYNNISADKKNESRDVYPVDDVQVSPDSDDVVIFSWLISGNATRYKGILIFLIKFKCLTGETIDYAWNTDIYSGITVGEGMDNTDSVMAEYSDVLEAWRAEVLMGIEAKRSAALNDIEKAKAEMLEEIEHAADIVQEPGDSATMVMSQAAVTKNINPILEPCVIIPKICGYYITTKGLIYEAQTLVAELTPKIACTSGEEFEYIGKANFAVAGVAFWQDSALLGYLQTTNNVETLNVVIPENCNYVQFCSYENLGGSVTLAVKKKNTTSYTGKIVEIEENTAQNEKNIEYLNSFDKELLRVASIGSNVNLFVESDKRNITEAYIDTKGRISYLANAETIVSHPIKVIGGVTYKYHANFAFVNNQTAFIAVCDSDGNCQSVFEADEVILDGRWVIFTPESDCYVRLSLTPQKIPAVVAAIENYPDTYIEGKHILEGVAIPYSNIIGLDELATNNPLLGKKLSVNGDSVCQGSVNGGGYAKIIGDNNAMTVQNISRGGGTIAAETYMDGDVARHWISRTINNMDADADYAIVEGGVNDASLGLPLGTLSEGFSAILDDTTFYGAFESMLKQLIIRFAGKKYGYIAVHKMTNNFRAENEEATSYYWAAKKCCEKWGVPFCDLNVSVPPFAYFNQSGDADLYALRTSYTTNGDGWHPNEAGYKKYYCDKIEAWLKTL